MTLSFRTEIKKHRHFSVLVKIKEQAAEVVWWIVLKVQAWYSYKAYSQCNRQPVQYISTNQQSSFCKQLLVTSAPLGLVYLKESTIFCCIVQHQHTLPKANHYGMLLAWGSDVPPTWKLLTHETKVDSRIIFLVDSLFLSVWSHIYHANILYIIAVFKYANAIELCL